MKRIIYSIIVAIFCFFSIIQVEAKEVEMYFFWGQGCPHCSEQKKFLEKIKQDYPELKIKDFEIYYNKDNLELFKRVGKAYGINPTGIPMTFIDKTYVSGFASSETTGKEIKGLIEKCSQEICYSVEDVLAAGSISALRPLNEGKSLCLHYFIQEECSQCENIELFLNNLSEEYDIEFHVYNISNKEDNTFYQKLKEFYNIQASVFPIVFLGNTYIIGDKSIEENIENAINKCKKEDCFCPVEQIQNTLKQMPEPSTFVSEKQKEVSVIVFGKEITIDTESSLLYLGIVLGLADGINPCMFSVLLFLLTYLIGVGSRKKAIKLGLIFTAGVFATYFFFMVGMINVISLIGIIQKIKIVIAVMALIAGLIMIKDYFAYGKWFSLEIPKSAKPMIAKYAKQGTAVSALVLAFLSSLVELPCTAGIPLVYITLLAQKGGSYISYLLWYNLFFVVPLLIIIISTTFAWTKVEKVEKWKVDFRKYMKLVAGLILVFLAIALLSGWM